jgi:hypothetical protein
MPVYDVYDFVTNTHIGTYTAQRPSIAACKGLTILRKQDKSIEKRCISIQVSSKKERTLFDVEYKDATHAFLGSCKKSIATKRHEQTTHATHIPEPTHNMDE